MAQYAIFNYQFEKYTVQGEEGELFPREGEIDANTAFPMRQDILKSILELDYLNEKKIVFRSKQNKDKEYIHQHVIRPTDDITILRIANKHTTTIVTKDLKEKQEADYQNCIMIIDNRPGIQRILIEMKKTAFQDVKQVANIFEYTLNLMMRFCHLHIKLMHLQDPRAFWQFANDWRSYPEGFYKITFHLPHLNLERLRKVFDKVLVMSREVFDSDLEWSYKAPQGGALSLDEKNPYQKELIEWMMKDVGSENIKLYSNAQKRKAIVVGEDSFYAVGISDTLIKRLTEVSMSGDLFSSSLLDEIKVKTKTGIDLNE